jgi:hypothetical protein
MSASEVRAIAVKRSQPRAPLARNSSVKLAIATAPPPVPAATVLAAAPTAEAPPPRAPKEVARLPPLTPNRSDHTRKVSGTARAAQAPAQASPQRRQSRRPPVTAAKASPPSSPPSSRNLFATYLLRARRRMLEDQVLQLQKLLLEQNLQNARSAAKLAPPPPATRAPPTFVVLPQSRPTSMMPSLPPTWGNLAALANPKLSGFRRTTRRLRQRPWK